MAQKRWAEYGGAAVAFLLIGLFLAWVWSDSFRGQPKVEPAPARPTAAAPSAVARTAPPAQVDMVVPLAELPVMTLPYDSN